MPIATKFEAEGVDNGFPHCLPKVDVSSYDYWTTLSGYNKNATEAPTDQQIYESKRLASAWYWNLDKVNLEAAANDDDFYGAPGNEPYYTISSESHATTYADYGYSAGVISHTPRDRICLDQDYGVTEDPTLASDKYWLIYRDSWFPAEDGPYIFSPIKTLLDTRNVARLYNGVTTDEANFVGYGLENRPIRLDTGEVEDRFQTPFIITDRDSYPIPYTDVAATLYLGCYADEITNVVGAHIADIDYTEVPIVGSTDSFHMVCQVDVRVDIAQTYNSTLDAANRELYYFATDPDVGQDGPSEYFEYRMQVFDMELYTYT
jgi:hypothetical protein